MSYRCRRTQRVMFGEVLFCRASIEERAGCVAVGDGVSRAVKVSLAL